jgi:hypothetical protein
MENKQNKGIIRSWVAKVGPVGFMTVGLSWAAMHQFGYSVPAILSSWEFLVGLMLGAALYSLMLQYHIKKVGKVDRDREESQFDAVLKNADKISFSRRVGDMVFMDYLELSLIMNLKSETLYIFKGEECVVTSSSIQDSGTVKQLRAFVWSRFGQQINDFVMVNGVAYSRQMIDFYTTYLQSSTSGLREHLEKMRAASRDSDSEDPEPPQVMDLDAILDKISTHGIKSLSKEELEFLKSQK